MTRTPPRLPFPGNAQRILRRPLLPLMTSPKSGRRTSAACNLEYSSSDSSSCTCRVKMDVSMRTIGAGTPFREHHDYTPMAYDCKGRVEAPHLHGFSIPAVPDSLGVRIAILLFH